jgi:prophage regulatory protein
MRYLTIKSMSREKLDDRARSTIYNDVEAGRLPKPIKLGGKNYFIEQEVDEYLIALREKDE